MQDLEKIDILYLILSVYGIAVLVSIVLVLLDHIFCTRGKINTKIIVDAVVVSTYGCILLIPWIIWDMTVVRFYYIIKGFK